MAESNHTTDDEQRELSEMTHLPSDFVLADIGHLVILIVDMLNRLIAHNDQIPLSPDSMTIFHSRCPASISVMDYVCRIVRYSNVEKSCLLTTLHYIDQTCARTPSFTITSLSVHRFLITAIAVSSKLFSDRFYPFARYAQVGGIRVAELNLLEREFLCLMDWRLTCTREVLDTYYVNLIRTHSASRYILMDPPPPQITAEEEEIEVAIPFPSLLVHAMISRPDTLSDDDSSVTSSDSAASYSRPTSHSHRTRTSTVLHNLHPHPQTRRVEDTIARAYLISTAGEEEESMGRDTEAVEGFVPPIHAA